MDAHGWVGHQVEVALGLRRSPWYAVAYVVLCLGVGCGGTGAAVGGGPSADTASQQEQEDTAQDAPSKDTVQGAVDASADVGGEDVGGEDVGAAQDSASTDAGLKDVAVEPKVLQRDLVQWVTQTVKSSPNAGSDAYSVPSDADLNAFRAGVERALDGDITAAQKHLSAAGYEVQLWRDVPSKGRSAPPKGDAHLLWAIVPQAGDAKHRGYFFIRKSVKHDLSLESPHSRHDTRTGVFGAELFRALEAHSFMFNAAHRCASDVVSSCSGTSTVCGEKAPYRESDLAHSTQSFFQVFHEEVYLTSNARVAVQLHGFKSKDDDPEFTLSNGTSEDKSGGLANTLAEALGAELAKGAKPANSCNAAGQLNRLCGTWNTQGRYSNGVPHDKACETPATGATERFIHLEMSYDLRHSGGKVEPSSVLAALKKVFPSQ